MKRNGVLVALDGLPDRQALRLVDLLGDRVSTYKVGLELFTRYGPRLLRRIQERGREVFLDLKYHDIPATVGKAVEAACGLGPSLLTVHASGGREMLRAAVRGRAGSRTRLLAVTVLTSAGGVPAARVKSLARLAQEAGFDGVIASGREAAELKTMCGKEFLVVVPGIRPAGAAADDQARVTTPAEAVRAGADYLVVGRPITRAEDPARALEAILKEARRARR
jgi:orotidine-5'-phosphate decarboxylase